MHKIKWLVIIIGLSILIASSAIALNSKDIEAEKKLGQDAAAAADKELKFLKDSEYEDRVQKIGQELAAIANTTVVAATYGSADIADFTYVFKLVDEKDVNAASLPGGFIYINKGLLDEIDSDDELAGVLAHEIAHISHHHMLQLLKKQSQYDKIVFAIIAAAVLGKAESADMQNLFYGAKLFEIAKLNSYSQEAEADADYTAIEYLVKTKYNPVGMLTFMEKLAREQAYNPVDPGIFQTHPLSRQRAESIIAQLEKHGIKVNRRLVSDGAIADVRAATIDDKPIMEVLLDDRVVLRPADLPGATSEERAGSIVDALNKAFDLNPELRDVKLSPDGTGVYIKSNLVVDVHKEDADLVDSTREELAQSAKQAIQAAIVREKLKLLY